MRMPNTVFAVMLGIFALYGLIAAGRAFTSGIAIGKRIAAGWTLSAMAAIVQVIGLFRTYSVALSIVTTILILVGLWLTRMPEPSTAT